MLDNFYYHWEGIIPKHKVTSVTKGVRYSAVSWVVGPTFK